MNQTPVQLRNAAARRLMARRRFREALDVLNEAIRADPRFAESYDNRAAVFEALGMAPQADADRRKVADLGGVKRPRPQKRRAMRPSRSRRECASARPSWRFAIRRRRSVAAAEAARRCGRPERY